MDRREFLSRAAAMTLIGGGSALAQAMLPHYAKAQTISFTDKRMTARYVEYDSPGGNSGRMRGYLVKPVSDGRFPAVLVIHENRGLNPHIEESTGFSRWRPTGWPRPAAIPAMTTMASSCSAASTAASCASISSTRPGS
jgi:hypothetical protein